MHYGPLVDSGSNRNEYQEYFLGVTAAGAYGWQPYHFQVPIVLKSGSLNLLEPSGPVRACNGIGLPIFICYNGDVAVGMCVQLGNVYNYRAPIRQLRRRQPLSMPGGGTHIMAVPLILEFNGDHWRDFVKTAMNRYDLWKAGIYLPGWGIITCISLSRILLKLISWLLFPRLSHASDVSCFLAIFSLLYSYIRLIYRVFQEE